MQQAGFVLMGGASSRMGRDKALLPFRDGTLGGHIARTVEAAAGSVTLIGDPARYAILGYPLIADQIPGQGPAGGIHTALHYTSADWNLVVACDMPGISVESLRSLLSTTKSGPHDAVLAVGPSGQLEPLCAVYHRRCAETIRRALDAGVRKVTETLAGLRVRACQMQDPKCLENLNTPEEWARYDAH